MRVQAAKFHGVDIVLFCHSRLAAHHNSDMGRGAFGTPRSKGTELPQARWTGKETGENSEVDEQASAMAAQPAGQPRKNSEVDIVCRPCAEPQRRRAEKTMPKETRSHKARSDITRNHDQARILVRCESEGFRV